MKALSALPGDLYWRDAVLNPPPIGVKLLLLTEGGVAVVGDWKDDGGFIAWCPLPKKKITKQIT